MFLQHLDEAVETVGHLLSAVIADDERHFQLGMFAQLIEFPRVEIGDEVTVVGDNPSDKQVIEPLGQIVQGQPEEREAYPRGDRRRNLHDITLHETGARVRQVHVAAWDESRIQ